MIAHLVRFNKQPTCRPHSFCLPSVEDLAFLVQIPPRLSIGSTYLPHFNDRFPRELDNLWVQASPDEELVACHIDVTNAFWSFILPEAVQGCFRVQIDGQTYGFSCLPFGWQFSPLICQYVLGFILESVHLDSVLVLQYIDDFLVVGYNKHCVRKAVGALSEALWRASAIISIKSVLEPVLEMPRLGKHVIFSGPNAGVFPKGKGWTSLVGLWIRTTVLPLTKKHARRIVGRYVWVLRPYAGYASLFSRWWAHCQWGANWLQNCPLSLLTSLLHCLIMCLRGWTPKLLFPLSICGGGTLFVDAAFDVDIFKIGVWVLCWGAVFHCFPSVRTQQEAELEALVKGVCLCINVGWPISEYGVSWGTTSPLSARCRR